MWGENTISGVSGPIGGGKISRVYDGSQADYIVKDKAQLIAALKVANYGDIIFMPKNTIIDWSNEAAQGISIDIPAGVSLVGSRGVDPDDQIALITTYKYKNEYAVIRLDEERSTVAGFRLEGPEKYPYKDLKKIIENNVSLGIASSGKNNLVLNMIIRYFSREAVRTEGNGTDLVVSHSDLSSYRFITGIFSFNSTNRRTFYLIEIS